ncbi:MAG: hypothetical protein ACFFDP_13465 [Promethearchaeota archaeon]
MEGFMQALQKLTLARLLLMLWSLITIITLIGLIGLHFILPTLLNEPLYYTILYVIAYAVIITVMMVGNRMISDLQKAITFVFVRTIIGLILPIPLILIAYTLPIKLLFAAFTIVSLIIFILTLIPIRTLLKLQKQLPK